MPRILTNVLCWCACLTLLTSALPARAAGAPSEGWSSETLLPNDTRGFVSITNVDDLVEHWNQTQLGALMADPVMEPFVKDFQRQLEQRFAELHKTLGLTIDDLKDVPSGELTVAVVGVARQSTGDTTKEAESAGAAAPAARALVVLMDVTGNLDKAKAMLEKAKTNLLDEGAKESAQTLSGTEVVILDLPKDPDAGPDSPRQAIYFLREDLNLLGACDDRGAITGVLARLAGEEKASFADVEPFRYVMERCARDAGEWTPQIRWFLEPIGYIELVEEDQSAVARRRGTSTLDILKNQGFEAVQGAGGFIDVGVEGYEILHRSAVFGPPPHEKSMKMMVFPNSGQFDPQPWLPREIASYMTFNADVLNAFDNFGPLFDELFGEGETGVWPDVLDSLKNDPNGPKIDLRAELFAHLANRVTAISDYQLPITTTSERLLFAVEAKDPKKVAAAVKKTLQNDEEIKRREFGQYVIWESVPRKQQEIPTISLALPPLGGVDEQQPGGPAAGGEAAALLPHAAVTVAHGQLLVASHYDFLIKVLQETDERETLGHDVAFRVIQNIMSQKLGLPEESSLRTFSRTDEEFRTTYELIRQGKMPQSETMLGRILNALFQAAQEGELRTQEIDGSKLPDYDFVRRSLGPAGMFGITEEKGWFAKGVMIGKEAP